MQSNGQDDDIRLFVLCNQHFKAEDVEFIFPRDEEKQQIPYMLEQENTLYFSFKISAYHNSCIALTNCLFVLAQTSSDFILFCLQIFIYILFRQQCIMFAGSSFLNVCFMFFCFISC